LKAIQPKGVGRESFFLEFFLRGEFLTLAKGPRAGGSKSSSHDSCKGGGGTTKGRGTPGRRWKALTSLPLFSHEEDVASRGSVRAGKILKKKQTKKKPGKTRTREKRSRSYLDAKRSRGRDKGRTKGENSFQ